MFIVKKYQDTLDLQQTTKVGPKLIEASETKVLVNDENVLTVALFVTKLQVWECYDKSITVDLPCVMNFTFLKKEKITRYEGKEYRKEPNSFDLFFANWFDKNEGCYSIQLNLASDYLGFAKLALTSLALPAEQLALLQGDFFQFTPTTLNELESVVLGEKKSGKGYKPLAFEESFKSKVDFFDLLAKDILLYSQGREPVVLTQSFYQSALMNIPLDEDFIVNATTVLFDLIFIKSR